MKILPKLIDIKPYKFIKTKYQLITINLSKKKYKNLIKKTQKIIKIV